MVEIREPLSSLLGVTLVVVIEINVIEANLLRQPYTPFKFIEGQSPAKVSFDICSVPAINRIRT